MKTKPAVLICLAAFVVLISASVEAVAQHPLDSWARRTVTGSIQNISSVAFGNGVFVAVGDASAVARSTNGSDWAVTTAGAFGNLTRVRFLNGEFVAVGSSDKIISSADGVTWASITGPQAGFSDIAFGNGVYVLAGSNMYASTNGVDWTQTHPMNKDPWPPYGPYETRLSSVLYAAGRFLALPGFGLHSGGGRSVSSTNGIDWVEGGGAPTGGDLLYADGLFVGTSYSLGITYGMYVSTDGANWCCRLGTPMSSTAGALAFGQGQYIYITDGSWTINSLKIYSSTDGYSWQGRSPLGGVIRSAAFGHGTFVAVGVVGTGADYILQSGNLSGAPSILQQPDDRAAVANNPASFRVTAVGAPPFAYQWYRNGTALANETNTIYSIASVQTADSGGYHVVINNSYGSVTSRVAQLTVAFLDINSYAGITVLGVPGRTYRIDATPATGTPNWQTVTNLVLPSTPYIWIDYESPTLPARLYRAAELP